MEIWYLVLVVAPFAVLMAVRRNTARAGAARSATVALTVDDDGIRRELADGRVEVVTWAEVREVEVLVATKGPHAASGGVVIIGDGEARGALVPLDRVAELGIVDHLCRLPGFDLNRFVDASNLPPNSRTEVWVQAPPAAERQDVPRD